MGVVLNWEEAAEYRNRSEGKVVFTNGVFDILHRGHVDYLIEARKLGVSLIVGVNTDASAKLLDKGPDRPLNNENDRAYLLSKLEPVDVVVLFSQPIPAELIEAIKPDIVVKGGDYRVEDVVGLKTMQETGGEVVIIPLTNGYSTTSMVNRIKRND